MNPIIPRNLIKHLEWTPGQEMPQHPVPSIVIPTNAQFSIDNILKGKSVYSEEKDSTNTYYIGVAVALREALEHAGAKGIVATMPELIAAKLKAERNHDFWKQWYTVHTEENIGIDTKGRFYNKDEPVLVVVNGGGILTPERIMKAYAEGLINHSAKYLNEEWENLLDGKLSTGTKIPLYRLEEIKKGVPNLPHQFGVVMPYALAQGTASGYHKKGAFVGNPLVIARAGGSEHLEAYFDLVLQRYQEATNNTRDTVGNHHPFASRDASIPQGRLLFLSNYYNGLNGIINLDSNGRFVGVAPEAHP